MTELKTFKIEQEFSNIEDLYGYLLKNVDLLTELTGIQIQKPLKARMHCIVGKEKITERNILFFASKSEFLESLGESIALAAAFSADVIVFFLPQITKMYLESMQWLQSICNADAQFIVAEVTF